MDYGPLSAAIKKNGGSIMKNIVFVLVTISVLLACGLPTGEPVAEVTAIPEKEIIESKWDEVTDSWTFPRGT